MIYQRFQCFLEQRIACIMDFPLKMHFASNHDAFRENRTELVVPAQPELIVLMLKNRTQSDIKLLLVCVFFARRHVWPSAELVVRRNARASQKQSRALASPGSRRGGKRLLAPGTKCRVGASAVPGGRVVHSLDKSGCRRGLH